MPTSKLSTSNRSLLANLLHELVAKGDYETLLNELLAVIHRDGGQYTDLAGVAVSTEDAIIQIVATRYRLRELERQKSR